jgi:hypothetical protein
MLSPKFSLWAFPIAALSSLLVVSPAIAQPAAQPKQLRFQPKLSLKWPGKAFESSEILSTEHGDEKHYSALFSNKGGSGVVTFSAFVIEFPDKAVKGTTPKELLTAYAFASKDDETSRKEVEHGPMKYPGLEISTKARGLFGRKLVVLAGSRLYEVSVSSKKEEALKAPEVKAFLESLALGK